MAVYLVTTDDTIMGDDGRDMDADGGDISSNGGGWIEVDSPYLGYYDTWGWRGY